MSVLQTWESQTRTKRPRCLCYAVSSEVMTSLWPGEQHISAQAYTLSCGLQNSVVLPEVPVLSDKLPGSSRNEVRPSIPLIQARSAHVAAIDYGRLFRPSSALRTCPVWSLILT